MKGSTKLSLSCALVLLFVGISLLSMTRINPEVDHYLKRAVASLNSKNFENVANYDWPAYFWVAVGSASIFGSSPIPLVLLNYVFILGAVYILLKLDVGLSFRQNMIVGGGLILVPEVTLYLLSPSRDSILASGAVVVTVCWILLLTSYHQKPGRHSLWLAGVFSLIVISTLRPTQAVIIGVVLMVVAIVSWIRLKRGFHYIFYPLPVAFGLFALGQWISNQIGGVSKSPSYIVSATIDGYTDTRSYWLGPTTSAASEQISSVTSAASEQISSVTSAASEQISSVTSAASADQFSSLALLLVPNSPLETVFMGLVRAPLLFLAPFGSSSAFQKLALVESSVQSMYWAALLSAVFLIALVPYMALAVFRPTRTRVGIPIQLLAIAGVATIILTASALPMIHERYRLSATVMLAFVGMVTLIRAPYTLRRKLILLFLPVTLVSCAWLLRIILENSLG